MSTTPGAEPLERTMESFVNAGVLGGAHAPVWCVDLLPCACLLASLALRRRGG